MTLQPLHYSTRAAEHLDDLADKLKIRWPDYDGFESFLAHLLQRAQTFQLPDNGQLFAERDYRPELLDLIRLPYPLIAVEFQADEHLFVEDSGLARADKRIGLAFNPAYLSEEERTYLALMTESAAWLDCPPEAIGLIAVYAVKNPPDPIAAWGFAPGFLLWDPHKDIPTPRDDEALKAADMPYWVGSRERSSHSLPVSAYPIRPRQRMAHLAEDVVMTSTLNDSIDELGAVWDMCSALNCRNVGVVREPAPAALNKKRAKAGKRLFKETAFLDVTLEKTAPAITRSPGAHASPRAHLRRGHIRRLPATETREARALWINATHVGQGVPPKIKPYRIHP